MRLLTTNTKLSKASDRYHIAGLALAPGNHSGHEVCAWRTAGCFEGCVLWEAGRTVSDVYRKAAIRRTRRLFEDRLSFIADVTADLRTMGRGGRKAGKRGVFVRLNVGSDLAWEGLAPELFTTAADEGIELYDYTKGLKRWLSQTRAAFPRNYQLTYSWNEGSADHAADVADGLAQGLNVAMVFDTPYQPAQGIKGALPSTWTIDGQTFRVVDGDRHDIRLRRFDGAGVIVGLRAKSAGNGPRGVVELVRSGFAQRTVGGIFDQYAHRYAA